MLKRIYYKGLSVLNGIIWKLHSKFEKWGIIKRINYSAYRHIENRIDVNHSYPINFNIKDEKKFSHYNGYKTGTESILFFKEVNVSYEGVVFKDLNNSDRCFPHTLFGADFGFLYILKNYVFRKKVKTSNDKVYILLFDFWSAENYYHWLIDSLPRLWIIQNELKQTNYSLLLPADCREFIKKTLNYFEVSHIMYIKKNKYVRVQKLYLPYYLAGSGHIHPAKIFEIKQFFVSKILSQPGREKVYVSRAKQKARKIINEQDVIKIVTTLGFEVVYFEDYTFEQQVEIGKGAKYMVSSHGANLTNMMFMTEGSRVLELIKSEGPNFCYWALANAAKVDYYYQLCEVKENDHLWVDIELFKLNLHKILND